MPFAQCGLRHPEAEDRTHLGNGAEQTFATINGWSHRKFHLRMLRKVCFGSIASSAPGHCGRSHEGQELTFALEPDPLRLSILEAISPTVPRATLLPRTLCRPVSEQWLELPRSWVGVEPLSEALLQRGFHPTRSPAGLGPGCRSTGEVFRQFARVGILCPCHRGTRPADDLQLRCPTWVVPTLASDIHARALEAVTPSATSPHWN
jgi:hypothetical protein